MAAHSALWAYAKVCRLEYLRGEAPAVFIPALIATSSVQALLSTPVLEAVAVFAVLYLSGFIVNALADRDLDVKYDSFKREIGEATGKLGVGRMRALLALHIGIALVLAMHLSWTLAAPELFAMAAVGTFLAMAYSLRPFHLKVRGIAAHAVALSLSAFAIPFLFLYRVAAGEVDAFGWEICAAFTLTHYGLTYTNQAYDFDLDLKEGVQTPPVRIGLRRSLRASAAMVVVGLPLLAFAATALALSRPTIAAAWGTTGAYAIALGTPALLWVGYSVPLRGVRRMLAAVGNTPDEAAAVPAMRSVVNYANFHAAGIASLAVFALLFFSATVQASNVLDNQAAESLAFEGEPTSAVGQLGSGWEVTVLVHNAGARTLPARSVIVYVSSAATSPNGVGVSGSMKLRWSEPILAGETVSITVKGFTGFPAPPGALVNVVLRFDANGDNRDLHEVDQTTIQLP